VEMLGSTGILTTEEAAALAKGLRAVLREIEAGTFAWRDDLEDVHTNVEVRLTELLGPLGAKVHTARSRNDQVALDERLFLRAAIQQVGSSVVVLQEALLALAEGHVETLMPGYTHLQRAQPVTLAHHLLAHVWRLSRDFERLSEAFARANVSPLGAGALAGSTLPIDPAAVAHRLGFAGMFENSLDAVSDRDPLAECLFSLALLAVHLGALGEELVLWSSAEFGFVEVGEEYATGSSIMPQKRNPDAAELVRGKAGRVFGHLTGFLATMKALPLSYNRDMQEDKEALFDTVDTLSSCLETMAGMLGGLRIKKERMEQAAREGYILATDLADYLVKKGVPFREAHRTLKELVAYAIKKKKGLGELDLQEYHSFSALFEKDVLAINLESSLQARRAPGGTAPETVERALKEARKGLEAEN